MHNQSPYLKFVTPAALALIAVIITAISEGRFDGPAFEIGFAGLAAASVAFVVANNTRGLGRFAKALAPALLTLLGIGVHYAVTGEWYDVDTRVALAGLGAALVTFLIPNTPPTPASQNPLV